MRGGRGENGYFRKALQKKKRYFCFIIDPLLPPPHPRPFSPLPTFSRHFTLCTWDEKGGSLQPSVKMLRVELYTLSGPEEGGGG